ncbi:MAG: HEAT repeat domain-containing protein, partial [Cyanobacteriota bacterium]
WERGYGFFDRSFRDYFTALSIQDWRFFWDVHQVNYRAFEPQWRSVMAFWLGREDVAPEDKQAFLEALLTFQDGCSPENFYGLQALKAAVLACGELPEVPQSQTALKILTDWAVQPQLPQGKRRLAESLLANADPRQRVDILLARLESAETEEKYRRVLQLLRQWGQDVGTAITGLESQLALLETSSLRFPVAETLGELDPGNETAIRVLFRELSQGSQSEDWGMALQGLGKIGQGHLPAIQTLLGLLNQSLASHLQRQVLAALAQIAPGHDLAIASLLQHLRRSANGALRCQVAESLEKIDPGNPAALSALRGFLQDQTDPDVRKQAIYSLGELKNPSDADITALAQLLQPQEDIFLQWLAVSSLSKIGQESLGAKTALEGLLQRLLTEPLTDSAEGLLKETIDALVKLDPANEWVLQALIYRLGQTQDLHACQEHAELLGRLDPGNPNAINALLTLLQKGRDEFVQRQAATSLGVIDPGNLTALMALIHLLHNGQSQDVRVMAAESLGVIGVNNPAAMAALLRTASGHPSRELLRAIVGSLGKIAQDNKEVSQVLLELFRTQTDPQLRLLIADCLQRILPNKMLTGAIHQLRDCCRRPYGQNTPADWEFFWHCSQRLPFPVFYQAWTQRPLKGEPQSNPTRRQRERESLMAQLATLTVGAKPLQTIWIDAGQFLSPQDPSVDIYDQMLSQNCPEFIHGIPDTPSKLRLYWHQLLRQRADQFLLLCLDYANGEPEAPAAKDFLTRLNAFQGAIVILSNHQDLPLKTFALPYERVFIPLRDWLLSDDR